MKPNFALTLSFKGIGLLHRTQAGWHLVGEVGLDSEDLAGDLGRLASTARMLNPTGLHTKLVIPGEQVKYLTFATDSRDPDIIDAQVRNALNGATPYALADLTYDWSVSAGEVYVAAVARETLLEAESFAVEHAFAPVSFVTTPEDGQFEGEPFFGQTGHSRRILGPDERVDRDLDAIRIVGAARLPIPDPVPEEQPEPPSKEATESAQEPATETEPAPVPAKPDVPSAPGKEDAATEPQDKAPVAFTSIRAAPTAEASASKAPSAPLPKGRFHPQASPLAPAEAATETPSDPPATPQPTIKQQPAQAPKPEPMAEQPPDPLSEATTTKAPPSEGAVSFLSRRKTSSQPEAANPPAAPDTPAGTLRKGGGKAWSVGGLVRSATRDTLKSVGRRKKAKTEELPPLPRKAPKSKAQPDPRFDQPGAGSVVTAPEFRKPDGATSTSPLIRDRKDQSGLDEKQRMTVFGARKPDNAPVRSRYTALILTAGLLLFLVGVAAWASLFLDDGISGLWRSDPAEVQTAEEAQPPPSDTAAQGADTGSTAPQEAEDTALAVPPDETGQSPESEAEADAANLLTQPEPIEEQLSPDEARARYAATGIWQVAPEPSRAPGSTLLEDVYQTTLDAPVNFADAVALPDAGSLRTDQRLATPADPPPPGVDFERDDRGFILATPDGTETPDGITIYSGPPPSRPQQTPERAETEIVQGPARAAPETPSVRPRLRPDDLSELIERSALGGRTLAELQDSRPRSRPLSPQEEATAAANAEARANGADFASDPFAGATSEAVAASLRPNDRPASIAAIVTAAREAAASAPVSAEQRVSVDIPTAASVARAATERNQISLRKVNLIGVYGQPGARRALVRLANGRYQKVQVGDRLDGGQVAVIDSDELRYVKRGQSVTLKMPKG